MNQSNRDRQTLYRRRRRAAQEHVEKLSSALTDAIKRVEAAAEEELGRGTRPGDGTPAGERLQEAQHWIMRRRQELEELREDEPFFYSPR